MLQSLSDGAKGGLSKFILVGFLFMAVAGLVLTDVGGFFRDGVSSTDVAEVGDRTVDLREFDLILRQTLSQRGIQDVQQAYRLGLVDRILSGYLQDIMIQQQAKAYGINVGREQVAAQLHEYIQPQVSDGMNPQQALDQLLTSQGISEAELASNVRTSMGNSFLINALTSGASDIPGPVLRNMARLANETRDIDYISLSPDDIELENPPTNEEIQEFYDLSRAEYAVPERRTFTVAILNPDTLKENVTVSEETVRASYDDNIDEYEKGETREIEQMIFDTQDEAAQFADQENPAFNENRDGVAYRESQSFQKNALPDSLAMPVFEMEVGNISEPVETPFGWHVIKLNAVNPPATESFDNVKDDIRQRMERDALGDTLFETVDAIDDQVVGGTDLQALVDDYNMETLTLGPVDRMGNAPDGSNAMNSFEGDADSLLEMAFAEEQGQVSPVMEITNSRFAVVKVDNIQEQSFRELEDVRPELEERLVSKQKAARNQERVDTLMSELEGDNAKTLEQVANNNGYELSTLSDVVRLYRGEREPPAPLTTESHNQLFAQPVDTIQRAQSEAGILIMRSYDQVIPPEEEIAESDIEEIRTAYQQMLPQEIIQRFNAFTAQQFDASINQRLIKRAYGPQSGGSRQGR